MKRTFVKFSSKRFVPAFIVIALLVAATPFQTMANTDNTIEIVSTENKASVQFAGNASDGLLFDVTLNNPKGDKFTLVIQGEDGSVLFSKEYTDTSFSKRVKILRSDDNNRYSISIHSPNKDLENYFSISTAVKTIENVVVTKL